MRLNKGQDDPVNMLNVEGFVSKKVVWELVMFVTQQVKWR